jgi:hypothetical protein
MVVHTNHTGFDVLCQPEKLSYCLPASNRGALDELPENLDENYEQTLLGIEEEKREYAHRISRCLSGFVHPLRAGDLTKFLPI